MEDPIPWMREGEHLVTEEDFLRSLLSFLLSQKGEELGERRIELSSERGVVRVSPTRIVVPRSLFQKGKTTDLGAFSKAVLPAIIRANELESAKEREGLRLEAEFIATWERLSAYPEHAKSALRETGLRRREKR